MSVSARDLANIAVGVVQEVETTGIEQIAKYSPLWEALIEGKGRKSLDFPDDKWDTLEGDPGVITGLQTGDEDIRSGFAMDGKRANESTGTMVYAWDVKEEDLRRIAKMAGKAKGSKGDSGAEWLHDSTERAKKGFMRACQRQLVMGNGTVDTRLFPTICGQGNYYNPSMQELRGGLLDIDNDADAQTANLHGLARNSQGHWRNQYAHVGGSANLTRMLTSIVIDAQAQQADFGGDGSIKFGFCDSATFKRWVEHQGDKVQFFQKGPEGGSEYLAQYQKGLVIGHGITLYNEPDIKIAQLSGNALLGLTYLLNPDSFQLTEHANGLTGSANFSLLDAKEHPTKMSWLFRYILNCGLELRMPCSNGVLTGTAQA